LDPGAGLHSRKTSGRDDQPDTYSDPGTTVRDDDKVQIDLTPVHSEDERYELVTSERYTHSGASRGRKENRSYTSQQHHHHTRDGRGRFFISGAQRGADSSLDGESDFVEDIISRASESCVSYESSTRYRLATPTEAGNRTCGPERSHKPRKANTDDEMACRSCYSHTTGESGGDASIAHLESRVETISTSMENLASLVRTTLNRLEQSEKQKRVLQKQLDAVQQTDQYSNQDEIGPDDSISRVSSQSSHKARTSHSNAPSIDQSIAELTSLVQSAFDRIDQLEGRKHDTSEPVKLSVHNKSKVDSERETLPKGKIHRRRSDCPIRPTYIQNKRAEPTIDRRVSNQAKHRDISRRGMKGPYQTRPRHRSKSENSSESRSTTPFPKPIVPKEGKENCDKGHRGREERTTHPKPQPHGVRGVSSDKDEDCSKKTNRDAIPTPRSRSRGRNWSKRKGCSMSRTHSSGRDPSKNKDIRRSGSHASKNRDDREYSSDSSDGELGPRHARKLVPAKFNGTTSVDSFFAQFESCALYNRWGERDKMAHLRWCLIDSASNILWDRGETTQSLTYKELSQKVRQRWGSEGQEERYQSELRSRRRKRGETLQNLYQEIRRLMSLAYPGELSKFSESIAKDAFLSALDDVRLELRCREQEPKDLDAALRIALRFEQYEKAVNGSLATTHTNRQLHSNVDAAIEKQLNELKLDVERMKRVYIEREKAEGRVNAIATGRQWNTGRSWDNAKTNDLSSNRVVGTGEYQRDDGNSNPRCVGNWYNRRVYRCNGYTSGVNQLNGYDGPNNIGRPSYSGGGQQQVNGPGLNHSRENYHQSSRNTYHDSEVHRGRLVIETNSSGKGRKSPVAFGHN